jgi:hypothetical protein
MRNLMKFSKILLALLIASLLINSQIKAQLITNQGDTITVGKGDVLYIDGGFDLKKDSTKSPYLLNKGNIMVSGNYTRTTDAIYQGVNDSTILFGTGAQAFPGFSYYRFLVNNGGIKTLSGKGYIKDQLVLNNGIIHTLNDTIQLDSMATIKEDSLNYLLGNMYILQTLYSGMYFFNGNIGLEVNVGNQSPGLCTIFRKNGPDAVQHGFCSNGIERYFDIKSTNNSYTASDIIFHYFPFELNGITRADLSLFQSLDNGSTWHNKGYNLKNTLLSTLSRDTLNPLARLTLASNIDPLINALKAGNPKSVCPGEPVQLGGDSMKGHVYVWTSIPAGYSSSSSKPIVNPIQTTTYYLKEIIPSKSCDNIDSVTITVRKTPHPSWTLLHTCPDYSFIATDTSFKSFIWNFGDGTTASGKTVTHYFNADSTYHIKLTVTDSNGCTGMSDSTAVFLTNTLNYKIFPNPFSRVTNINFVLCQQSNVLITIFDDQGRSLGIIQNGNLNEGIYSIPIDFKTHTWRPGIYLVKTKIDNHEFVNKVVRAE